MIRFAYNTNGAANHRLEEAVRLIADAGYDGVALTLDHHHLDPMQPGWQERTERLAKLLAERHLASVIETGARFLLNPSEKHEPTLVTASPEGRALRIDFLRRAVDIAAILQSEAVSFWAGVPKPNIAPEQAWAWLREGVEQVIAHAGQKHVTAALEPEPGMLVETLDQWSILADHAPGLRLALDLGHCLVTNERTPAGAISDFSAQIGTIAIEDMRRGIHVHLPFGEGDMDIPSCLDAIDRIGFAGLVCVELSRESHRADTMVRQAIEWLGRCRESRAA